MPRFAANISTMFREREFLDRIGAAADAGFEAVECQWPYDVPAPRIARELSRHGISMVLINAPAGNPNFGDMPSGDVGTAAIPGREIECRAGVDLALRYCQDLGCSQVHLLSGCPPAGHAAADCRSALIENVRYAADLFRPHDVQVLLEPINNIDVPGYFLSRAPDVLSVIEQAERENTGLQFDFYHACRMGDELQETLLKFREAIVHIQISGSPGRHEPDVGDIDYPPLFKAIDGMGYAGWVGCEYTPKAATLEGLGWLNR